MMFLYRVCAALTLTAFLAVGGCIAKRESSELFLKGSIAESSEVVQLDPVFLSRQRQVENSFFGFDDQASSEKANGRDASDNGVVEAGADEPDVSIELPAGTATAESLTSKLFPVSLNWPLDGHVTSPFGMRRGRLHAGVDIKGLKGDPIIAAADGQILLAKRKRAYGVVAVVGHDHDTQTLYAHMLRLAVREGQYVRAGEVLGYVGRSGRATGYHLHFETRVSGGVPQDPLRYLPPVRTARVGFLETPSSGAR